MATVQLPMTMEALIGGVDPEPGYEPQFCPVHGMPIKRTHRVRALPGFHLLSLGAGKEAMALGSYKAFGKTFICEGLDYLHPDDKVFICPEDNKAFLNQMSMRYHQYIRHELEERKAERKRLRERAEERKARADRHRQQPEVAAAHARNLPAAPVSAASSLLRTGSVPADAPAIAPELQSQGVREDPYMEAAPAVAVKQEASDPPRPPAPAQAAPTLASDPRQPVAKPAEAVAPADEEDLYGDIGGGEAKRQKTGSSYATAMNAMLGGDFEDDEI
eukprot:TRINITY_DN22026_c0_g1_i6.p1 TRINITY_DN22026_c0_g1~~TRINITY_DN22026_c0_g1_i6.p1  ORF type:complete len:275 (-),score=65.42 TRINITY_DN22026_c0_g1_i6:63-887(-)